MAKSKSDLIIYLFRSIRRNGQLSIKRLTAKSADVYLNIGRQVCKRRGTTNFSSKFLVSGWSFVAERLADASQPERRLDNGNTLVAREFDTMATFPLDDAFKIFQLLFASIVEDIVISRLSSNRVQKFLERIAKNPNDFERNVSVSARLKPIARIDACNVPKFSTLLKAWIWHRMEGKQYCFLSNRMISMISISWILWFFNFHRSVCKSLRRIYVCVNTIDSSQLIQTILEEMFRCRRNLNPSLDSMRRFKVFRLLKAWIWHRMEGK